jgi:hypothetical protein
VVEAGAGHAAGAQFVDHRHLAERGVVEQHFNVYLRVDEGHVGDRGLLDLTLADGHHELAGARAVKLGLLERSGFVS